MCEGGGGVLNVSLGTTLHHIYPLPCPHVQSLCLEMNLWTGINIPQQTPYAISGFPQGYFPRRGYRGKFLIHTSQPSLWFFIASYLGFAIFPAWTSNIFFCFVYGLSLSPHPFFPKFKHSKAVDIAMGDMKSLSTYPHYWNSSLVIHILSWKFYYYFKLAQGWNCHQAEFQHSGLGRSTDGVHSLMLLTPRNILLCPGLYS